MYVVELNYLMDTGSLKIQLCIPAWTNLSPSSSRIKYRTTEIQIYRVCHLLWRNSKCDICIILKNGRSHLCAYTNTWIVHIRQSVFHTSVIFYMIYVFECMFGAIWPPLCWCAVKPSKTNKRKRNYTTCACKLVCI